MQLGMGVLGWAPSEFWRASPRDFFAAWEGWQEANTVKKPGEKELSKDELDDLRSLLEEEPKVSQSIKLRLVKG